MNKYIFNKIFCLNKLFKMKFYLFLKFNKGKDDIDKEDNDKDDDKKDENKKDGSKKDNKKSKDSKGQGQSFYIFDVVAGMLEVLRG